MNGIKLSRSYGEYEVVKAREITKNHTLSAALPFPQSQVIKQIHLEAVLITG